MNEVEKKVKDLLQKIRPYLQRDGGDVKFVKMDDGVVYVELMGACVGCASANHTLKVGIESILKEQIPEVKSVEKV